MSEVLLEHTLLDALTFLRVFTLHDACIIIGAIHWSASCFLGYYVYAWSLDNIFFDFLVLCYMLLIQLNEENSSIKGGLVAPITSEPS